MNTYRRMKSIVENRRGTEWAMHEIDIWGMANVFEEIMQQATKEDYGV